MTTHKYETLKIGDVRKIGDQYRQLFNGWTSRLDSYTRVQGTSLAEPNPDSWQEVNLVGWAILPADLFNAEFRRRIV